MHLNMAGSTTNSVPLGIRIKDAEKLYNLARENSPNARAELSATISSILEGDVSLREGELIADVLIKLMRQAEVDLRQAVAEQISVLDNVPLRLVLQLANDEIEVAKPILKDSPVLGEFDLMYIIKSKTAEYWQVIAERANLSEQVVNVLADTKDLDTALKLVENKNIKLGEHALVALSDIAQGSEVLAPPLLRRPEVTSDIAASLYEYVGAGIKKFISDNYDVDAAVSKVVDKAVKELSTPVTPPAMPKEFIPDDYMIEAAKTFKEKGMLNITLMLSTLRRGHMRSFVAQFSVYTGLSVKTIGQILLQMNGQGLAVLSRAHNIDKQDYISIFMLTGKIWNHGCIVGVRDIKAAMDYYNKITPEMAIKILKNKDI